MTRCTSRLRRWSCECRGVWAGRWCRCWTTSVPVHFPVVVRFVVVANGSSSRSAPRRSVCFLAWCLSGRSVVRRQSSLAPCWGDVGGWPCRRQQTSPRRQHRWSDASHSHLRYAPSSSVAGSYTIFPDEIRLVLEWVSHLGVLLCADVDTYLFRNVLILCMKALVMLWWPVTWFRYMFPKTCSDLGNSYRLTNFWRHEQYISYGINSLFKTMFYIRKRSFCF